MYYSGILSVHAHGMFNIWKCLEQGEGVLSVYPIWAKPGKGGLQLPTPQTERLFLSRRGPFLVVGRVGPSGLVLATFILECDIHSPDVTYGTSTWGASIKYGIVVQPWMGAFGKGGSLPF